MDDEHLPINDSEGAKELKRLYAMTQDEAIAQTLKGNFAGRLPIQRWFAAQELRKWHSRYKEGDQSAILESLYLCTLNDLPMPAWLSMAYLQGFRGAVHYRAKSWDDVFGAPHPKCTHLAAKRQRREKAVMVYNRIQEIRRKSPETAIDGYLFETVGRELGVGGKTLTEEYYYFWVNRLKNIIPTKI